MVFIFSNMLVNLIGVFVAFVVTLVTYFQWKYQYWKKKNIPYLQPTFPFGNLDNPLTRKGNVGLLFGNMYKNFKEQNFKHAGFYIFARHAYMPINLDYLKNIMTKDFTHFTDRGLYVNERDDPLGAHLFSIGGIKWRNLRTKLTPTFTSGKMKSMFQTLTNCGIALENYMCENVSKNEPIDIKEILACFTTDIIGSCAFGLECNSFKEPDSPFRIYGKKVFVQTKLDALKFAFVTNLPNLAKKLHIRMVAKDVSDFYYKVVENTVNYREKNHVNRKDFLQLLIDIKNNKTDDEQTVTGDGTSLTMNEIAAQSFVFFLAGFETSSTTMTFALYELASNQAIQDKMRQEVNTVLNKYDGKITYDSMNDLKYMGQVIDETLRKYPPVPMVTRVCVKDYKLPNEDVIIEEGTRVFIPIIGIHYDEEYYPNPNVFDPDRFTEENKAKRHPYAHIPFGEGPRICIGMRFGLMQTKVGLACLIRNYKFTLNERTQVPLKMSPKSFILTTEGGVWLNAAKL